MSAPGMPPGPQMQGAPGPQHRSQQLHVQQQPQQGGPGSAVAQFHGPGASARLPELLEAIKAEFQTLADEMHVYKMQRDEYAEKFNAQVNELSQIRGNLLELERMQATIKQQYEEDVMRLRRELEQAGVNPGANGQRPAQVAPKAEFAGVAPSIGSGSGAIPDSLHRPPGQPPAGGSYVNGAPPPIAPIAGMGGPAGTPPLGNPNDPNNPNKRLRGPEDGFPRPPGGPGTPGATAGSPFQRTGSLGPPGDSKGLPGIKDGYPGPGTPTSATSGSASALPSMQASTPTQMPPPGAISQPVTGHCDLDPETVPANYRKEGPDWVVVYNPKLPRTVNVELVHSLDHQSVVCCVKFSQDGKFLATGCNRMAQIFDAVTGAKIMTLAEDFSPKDGDLYIRSVCFSPDAKYLATGAEDKMIRIWDIQRKKVKFALPGHDQDIYSLDWSRDGRYVVSGSGDRTVRIWEIESGRCLVTMMNEDDKTMGQFARSQPTPKDSGVTSVAISPLDGRVVAAGSLDKMVRLWDARTGQLLERFDGHKDSVYSVAFSSDGKSIVSGSLDKTLKIWDISPPVLSYLAATAHIDLSEDGQPPDSFPRFEALVTTTCRHTFAGHKDFVLSVAYGAVFPSLPPQSEDECREWVVSGSKDRTVTFWDARGPRGRDPGTVTQFMLQGHKNSVISVALSPVGGMFATGSGDWRARIWRYSKREETS